MSRPLESRYPPASSPGARRSRAGLPGGAAPVRSGLAWAAAGLALYVLVLLVGVLAKTGPVARAELGVDRHIAVYDRTGLLTGLARAATVIATPETVGVGLMILVPVVLVLMRRRLDALKVFGIFAGSFVLAEIGKKVISEHRPPAALWAMKAGNSASYPSGHATTAAALALALAIAAVSYAARRAALVLGILYAVAVAASRVYLADHYPLDVLGGMLCAVAAALLVTGLAALPAVQPWLRRLEPGSGRHR